MKKWPTVSPRVWRAARIVALIALTAVVMISLRGVDWSRTGAALREGRPSWLVAAIVFNSLILVCWAAYWRLLRPVDERPVSYSRMLEVSSVSSSLMNTLPFGAGHASSILLLIRRADTTPRGALSLLALDQLGEGIVKVAVLLTAGLIVPLPAWIRATLATVSLVVGAWFVTLIVASRYRRELELLRNARRSLTALACVIATKATELAAIACVQRAYGVDISMGGTLLILATVILATMLPVAPGNLGAYEGSVFLTYRYLGVSPELALSMAIVQHVCFMLPAIGIGYLFMSAQALSRNAIASR